MKTYKRLFAFLLSLISALMLLPAHASAAGYIDLNHDHSLTVTAVYDQSPISGMRFDAYLVSEVDKHGELTVIDRYQDYAGELDIRGRNDAAWQEMAEILAREILLDPDLKPSRSAVTENDGAARFTDIPMGLYLILGSSVEKDGYVYSTLPFFALLPEQDLNGNTWNYHVAANAKPGQEPVKADYKVIKIWNDDCHRDQRPQSITISLICDGTVYDTILLPQDGAWSYTWNDLETNHHWTVTELPVDGYEAAEVRQEGSTFIVTNTCGKPSEPGNPTLPQTGQLWWPVPVLAAAGLLLIVCGLFRRRGNGHEG